MRKICADFAIAKIVSSFNCLDLKKFALRTGDLKDTNKMEKNKCLKSVLLFESAALFARVENGL